MLPWNREAGDQVQSESGDLKPEEEEEIDGRSREKLKPYDAWILRRRFFFFFFFRLRKHVV